MGIDSVFSFWVGKSFFLGLRMVEHVNKNKKRMLLGGLLDIGSQNVFSVCSKQSYLENNFTGLIISQCFLGLSSVFISVP